MENARSLSEILQQIPSILETLPRDAWGFYSMFLFGIFFVGFLFFRSGHPGVKVLTFCLMIASGFSAGFSGYSLATPQLVDAKEERIVGKTRQSLDQAAPPREPISFDFIPSSTNILVFDASNSKDKGSQLAKYLASSKNSPRVEIQKSWKYQYVMDHTRIYYLGAENYQIALDVANGIPGKQFVIDYYNQDNFQGQTWWPDRPPNYRGWMEGFNSSRDLVVFAGEDIR